MRALALALLAAFTVNLGACTTGRGMLSDLNRLATIQVSPAPTSVVPPTDFHMEDNRYEKVAILVGGANLGAGRFVAPDKVFTTLDLGEVDLVLIKFIDGTTAVGDVAGRDNNLTSIRIRKQ